MATEDVPPGDAKSDRHKSRLSKRKIVNDSLTELREELLDGGYVGYVLNINESPREMVLLTLSASLLVASQYDPLSILEKLTPYLAGSASIVVHSPYVQVRMCLSVVATHLSSMYQIVTDLQSSLRALPQYLGSAVTEAWLRRYQVRLVRLV